MYGTPFRRIAGGEMFKATARADMKRVVTSQKLTTLKAALHVAAKCAGLASYVTLVFLLTQKNLADQAAQETKAIQESHETLERVKAHRRAQQATFVSKIIRLHTSPKEDVRGLAEIIVSESEKANFDPLFVAAVIRSESMFKNRAISSRGAKGLMQLMPATGKYISERENIALKKSDDLHDPAINVRIGIAYLKYLEAKFHGNRERVLLAYNWGPANVALSMKGAATPPSQSVQYAKKILAAHSQWEDEFTQLARTTEIASSLSMLG
jgi:soluble lytic murein transglycosylase-like protein